MLYEEWLWKLNDLPTQSHQKPRGDMMDTYKIMNVVYDVCKGLFVQGTQVVTRWHDEIYN